MNEKKFKYKLYGRTKGRKKLDHNLISLLDLYRVDIKKDLRQNNYNILDIGSGNGENAILLAKKNSKSKIISCEIYKDGNINLCKNIKKNNFCNIFLYEGNVLELINNINVLPMFDEIWILFPDPWPKIRHHKRRLINRDFINEIYFLLKSNGKLFIASDSISYNEKIINLVYELKSIFSWKNQKFNQWNYDGLDLPRTKFYKKAFKSNRKTMFFELCKI